MSVLSTDYKLLHSLHLFLKLRTMIYKARNGKFEITPQHPSATPAALRRLIIPIQHNYINP